ncbi:hypothetical protein M0R04_07345 [Candidatus Dojkabacteria bacterium]|jgi:hypothetical protein|nr:hypothetical protein [Candidatus Dojkabacteria bacterium]
MSVENMSWNDKLALIEKYHPSDKLICDTFGITISELEVALKLKNAGTFAATEDLDIDQYDNLFWEDRALLVQLSQDPIYQMSELPTAAKSEACGDITTQHIEQPVPAESATKKVVIKVPKKRGRKGDKITQALFQVTEIPEPALEFAQQHNVSLAVLKQAKRFIATMSEYDRGLIGKVIVKQDKETKIQMVWREDV